MNKVNNLQVRQLKNFCRKHRLDTHLIDGTLTYAENKQYLESQRTDLKSVNELFDSLSADPRLDAWASAEEEYFQNHFLMYYVLAIRDGSTKSSEIGEVRDTEQRFSLKQMAAINQRFSLKTLLLLSA